MRKVGDDKGLNVMVKGDGNPMWHAIYCLFEVDPEDRTERIGYCTCEGGWHRNADVMQV